MGLGLSEHHIYSFNSHTLQLQASAWTLNPNDSLQLATLNSKAKAPQEVAGSRFWIQEGLDQRLNLACGFVRFLSYCASYSGLTPSNRKMWF